MEILSVLIGVVSGAIVKATWDMATKADDRADARKESRAAVTLHLRRVITAIDGLDTYVRFHQKPSLEHVRMVRGMLQEREKLEPHIQKIGDARIEREVREWYQLTADMLQFLEDYTSGDPAALQRYNADAAGWERLWGNQYALHSRQIIEADRLATELIPPKQKPTPRKTHVPPEATLPPSR